MMGLATTLERELAEFDGKALTRLTETRARHEKEPGFLASLIELASNGDANIASGSTWLLKDHLEKGGGLTPDQVADYSCIMPDLAGWQAQLHACQSLQFLMFNENEVKTLVPWLERLIRHNRPFLRAWSLDGLARIALQHDVFGNTAARALEHAAEDEAASVRARARKLEKLLARA